MNAVLELHDATESAPQADPPSVSASLPAHLQAVIDGDRQARRDFVHEHQRAVFAVIGRVLGRRSRRDLVEDLAQETFLRAFRALPAFDPHGRAKLSTWILRIASNAAIDELRKKDRQAPASETVLARLPARDGADVSARQAQLAEKVREALEDLSPEFRAVFVMRAFEDLSHAEIAQALDLEIGTVKSRIARARARLKVALSEVRDDHA